MAMVRIRRGAVRLVPKLAFLGRVIGSILTLPACVRGAAPRYSWQQTQAEVLPRGDLQWRPTPFVFQTSARVRYIDFRDGCDDNPGDTSDRPWKHHPWDPNATGKARADDGRYTYVFKRGVIYRGRLIPNLDGTSEQPIILTSDPTWGSGEATLVGSEQVTDWHRGGGPEMPEPEKVWHADIGFLPRAVWVVLPEGIQRLALARTPNWSISRWDDIHNEWATWKAVRQVRRGVETVNRGWDPDVLGRYTPEQLRGAIVWTEYAGFMGTAYPTAVLLNAHSPDSIDFRPWVPNPGAWTAAGNRYFLEDRPAFLDAPGEFWFDRKGSGGRLYLRLPGDRDPSGVRIEAARYLAIIDATRLMHVHIRGLTFRFTNLQWDLTEPPLGNSDVDPAAIRLQGSGDDIDIDHCRFEYVTRAVRLRAYPDQGGSIDNVLIADNDVHDTDHGAFYVTDGYRWAQIAPPYGTVGRVRIMRNRCTRIGFRPYVRSHGHAIQVDYAALTEVAGNILDRIHGAGIFVFGGIADGQSRDAPLSRHLIYQNRVDQPLLGTNDWGGIETWQAGPFYVFDNVCIDPGGFRRVRFLRRRAHPDPPSFRDSRFGFAYYFDGSSKNYVFNNIALGGSNDPASPDCNTGAFYETITQDNSFFNNSAARFAAGFVGFNRTACNSIFVGNVLEDMSLGGWYFALPRKLAPTIQPSAARDLGRGALHKGELALADNVLAGQPAVIGSPPAIEIGLTTLSGFRSALKLLKIADARVGEVVPRGLLPRYQAGDFRLAPRTEAAGRGARVFVPWGLYGCVAEWNFHLRRDHPGLVSDDHWYLTWGYLDRERYASLPRPDLHGINLGAEDFIQSPLDNWIRSAVRLNGSNQYLVLPDAALYRPTQITRTAWGKPGPPVRFDQSQWRTPDMGRSNFLIEAYLRPAPRHGGLILAKDDGRTGYELSLDASGYVNLRLEKAGKLVAERTSSAEIADGGWHHLVVQVDRTEAAGITLWVDGKCDEGPCAGRVTDADLNNRGDVLVGGGPGHPFLKGDLAFLRICLGTLAQARTDIDELRAWEFAGPQYADFTGRVPTGARDAGALQATMAAAAETGR